MKETYCACGRVRTRKAKICWDCFLVDRKAGAATPEQMKSRRREQDQKRYQRPERRASKLGHQRRWIDADPKRAQAVFRNAALKSKYGITTDEWEDMFDQQGRCCACCNTLDPGSKIGWSTDHDHATGRIRGILCWRCNRTLGTLGDTESGVDTHATMFKRYLSGPMDGISAAVLL